MLVLTYNANARVSLMMWTVVESVRRVSPMAGYDGGSESSGFSFGFPGLA